MDRAILVAILMALLAVHRADGRTWEDSTGRYRVEAELIDCNDGTVRLKKGDGAVISISVERLSTQDKDYLRKRNTPAATSKLRIWI